MDWLTIHPHDLRLTLHIQPGAKKSEIVGLHGDALKIRLAAPPVDGKANAALMAFIAQKLGIAQRDVQIRSGECSRRKVLAIALPEASFTQVRQTLLPDDVSAT